MVFWARWQSRWLFFLPITHFYPNHAYLKRLVLTGWRLHAQSRKFLLTATGWADDRKPNIRSRIIELQSNPYIKANWLQNVGLHVV
jgi:hypothetical protein